MLLPHVDLVPNLGNFTGFSVFILMLQYCSRGFRGHFGGGGVKQQIETLREIKALK